ncbi:hypothetical protein CT850_10655 [Salmonella enterica]|nr:hypothetical protein [Salmonella enterica]
MWSIFGYGGKYHFFIDYMQKISLRKGDYAGQGGGSWYSWHLWVMFFSALNNTRIERSGM